jgi:hypothetical protein
MAETLSAKTSQALGITDPIKDLTTKRDTAVQEELGAGAAVQALETRKAESEAKRTSEQAKEKVRSTEELTQRQVERETPIKEQKSAIDKALMNEHFAPSKENLQDQAALFSLINVIGFAIGTGGKQNSMMAMHAMNGMLEGHQKGRADLFKQEQIKFEKNFKALQQKATFLETELRHSLEEFTRDKRAADERASAAFASAGADFMKIYAEKNGLVAAYERAKEVRKSLDKAIEGERLRKERVEDKATADAQRAEDQRKLEKLRQEDRKELRQFGASLKTSASGVSQDLPKDTKTKDEHRFRHVAKENVRSILDDLQDPQIRKLIGPQNQYIPDVILNLQDKYPALAQKLAKFQSQEFQIGGKALTLSEQKILGPIYNWRNLTAKGLEDNLKEAIDEMGYQQDILEAEYPGFKRLTERYSGVTKTGETPRKSFNSVQEAEAANLPKGTKILVGGKPATVE